MKYNFLQSTIQFNNFQNIKGRKTYLRYPGGKSKSTKALIGYAPEFKEYRETMIGGGSVFLALKSKYPERKYWINDIYYNLVCFWKIARDDNRHLVETLLRIKSKTTKETSAQKFVEFRDSINEQDEFLRAVYFYYLNKCSFSGLTESGTCSPQAWVQNFSSDSIESLRDLKEILRGVKITNLDYGELIRARGDSVFVYLDPPYDIGQQNHIYGKDGAHHSDFDHLRFAADLAGCKHKAMISYNDSPVMRERYQDYFIRDLKFTYTMRQAKTDNGCAGKVKNELVICNYAIQ
jgi:DNA adenine methylase